MTDFDNEEVFESFEDEFQKKRRRRRSGSVIPPWMFIFLILAVVAAVLLIRRISTPEQPVAEFTPSVTAEFETATESAAGQSSPAPTASAEIPVGIADIVQSEPVQPSAEQPTAEQQLIIPTIAERKTIATPLIRLPSPVSEQSISTAVVPSAENVVTTAIPSVTANLGVVSPSASQVIRIISATNTAVLAEGGAVSSSTPQVIRIIPTQPEEISVLPQSLPDVSAAVQDTAQIIMLLDVLTQDSVSAASVETTPATLAASTTVEEITPAETNPFESTPESGADQGEESPNLFRRLINFFKNLFNHEPSASLPATETFTVTTPSAGQITQPGIASGTPEASGMKPGIDTAETPSLSPQITAEDLSASVAATEKPADQAFNPVSGKSIDPTSGLPNVISKPVNTAVPELSAQIPITTTSGQKNPEPTISDLDDEPLKFEDIDYSQEPTRTEQPVSDIEPTSDEIDLSRIITLPVKILTPVKSQTVSADADDSKATIVPVYRETELPETGLGDQLNLPIFILAVMILLVIILSVRVLRSKH